MITPNNSEWPLKGAGGQTMFDRVLAHAITSACLIQVAFFGFYARTVSLPFAAHLPTGVG
jgi:hypothetical protein